jgi:transitional endoplasmic reticulum ATPase
MKGLARSTSQFVFHLVLATMLYSAAHAFMHSLASGRLQFSSSRPLMLGLALSVAVLLWFLHRKYRVVRRVALLMFGVAIVTAIAHVNHDAFVAIAGSLALALVVRALYRWARTRGASTRSAMVRESTAYRELQADLSQARSLIRPYRSATSDRVSEPARDAEPIYYFDDLIAAPRFDFSRIVGMTETKARLLRAAGEILSNPQNSRNGVLLSGEPGNGKTMFAEALAGELGVPFFSLDYGSVASKWVNETPAKIKAAFAQVIKQGRGVFLIDEFEAFVKPRDGAAHHMDRDLTNVMLTELVRLRGTQIILVAATNNIDALDSAALREGRFDFKIEVPPPDLDARKAILRRSIGDAIGFHAIATSVLDALATRWEGFSAARLASVGPELADMRREGAIGEGKLTFEIAMRALRRLQGSNGRLPENVKSIDDIIMPDVSRNDLHDLAFKLQHAYDLEQLGSSLPRGVLFYGPPGTGKTQGAMALAAASGYAFLKTTGAELLGNPSAWDKLVKDAKNLRPAIVFIDEADDVLSDRRLSGIAPVTNRVLTVLDGAGGRLADVIYICATNQPDVLDAAVLRGGRIEQKIRFDVPTPAALASYIRTRLRSMAGDTFTVSRQAMDYAVIGLKGRSIADADAVLQCTVDLAAMRHLREGAAAITAQDVHAALRSTSASF